MESSNRLAQITSPTLGKNLTKKLESQSFINSKMFTDQAKKEIIRIAKNLSWLIDMWLEVDNDQEDLNKYIQSTASDVKWIMSLDSETRVLGQEWYNYLKRKQYDVDMEQPIKDILLEKSSLAIQIARSLNYRYHILTLSDLLKARYTTTKKKQWGDNIWTPAIDKAVEEMLINDYDYDLNDIDPAVIPFLFTSTNGVK